MACRIPGCSTRYWDKNNKCSMFKAASDADYQIWEAILSERYDIKDFRRNDRICILHFEESAFERTRTVYHFGGSSEIVPLAKPELALGAIPTLFPPIPSPIARKKENKYYNVIKDNEILTKQRKIFEENTNYHVIKKAIKRKLESKSVGLAVTKNILPQGVNIDPDCDDNNPEGVTSVLKRETSNPYQIVVDAIHNNEKVFYNLSKKWIPIFHSDNYVMWSFWNEDRSCIKKSITLHADLKVEVFVNEKQISIPESENIREMDDLQTLFEKVERISPCLKADGNSSDSVCLGFVTKDFGRPRLRCTPCSAVQRNVTRRKVAVSSIASE